MELLVDKVLDYLSLIQWSDGSHDISHFKRVSDKAILLSQNKGDKYITKIAALLHDIVNVPKNSPLRSKASKLSADQARTILYTMDFTDNNIISEIQHCIEAHSFSANITPLTWEAKCVQDADRLEALGAIGVVRCFYVSGKMTRGLYHEEDPLGENRTLDDVNYTLDHFELKLKLLPDMMNTDMAKLLSNKLWIFMDNYRKRLGDKDNSAIKIAQLCYDGGVKNLSIDGEILDEIRSLSVSDNDYYYIFYQQLLAELSCDLL